MTRRAELDALKSALPLSGLVGDAVSWDRRRSNPARGDFWAPCPFHAERTPSFHVDDRKGFYFCFGCQAKGDHLTWCQEYLGDDFPAAVERLAGLAGIAPGSTAPAPARRAPDPEPRAARARLALARRIWRESAPGGQLLLDYLAARGVAIAALERTWGGLPPCLRLHPDLPHRERGRVIHRGPAMVARISRPGRDLGVHRTWITARGRARVGSRPVAKQWLGLTGRIWGAPVRFTAHTRRMVVGEGIETVLAWWSRQQLAWLDGAGPHYSAEAALSLGALAGAEDPAWRAGLSRTTGRPLPSVVPDWARPGWLAPDFVDELVILGEGSAKDPEAAERHARRALRRHRFKRDGSVRRCRLLIPAGGWGSGLDFADVAVAEGAA